MAIISASSEMRWRKVYVWILDNFGFEALCMAKPDLGHAGLSLDRDATWIDVGLVNQFSTK